MKVEPVGFAQQVGCGYEEKNRFLVTPKLWPKQKDDHQQR